MYEETMIRKVCLNFIKTAASFETSVRRISGRILHVRVLQLFCNVVELIPAVESPQSLIKRRPYCLQTEFRFKRTLNVIRVSCSRTKSVYELRFRNNWNKNFTDAKRIYSCHDNNSQRCKLSNREYNLQFLGDFDTVAVNKRNQTCFKNKVKTIANVSFDSQEKQKRK